MLYTNPKVLATLHVIDFFILEKSRNETLEQGFAFFGLFLYLSHV
jgi:hypothetical protein